MGLCVYFRSSILSLNLYDSLFISTHTTRLMSCAYSLCYYYYYPESSGPATLSLDSQAQVGSANKTEKRCSYECFVVGAVLNFNTHKIENRFGAVIRKWKFIVVIVYGNSVPGSSPSNWRRRANNWMGEISCLGHMKYL